MGAPRGPSREEPANHVIATRHLVSSIGWTPHSKRCPMNWLLPKPPALTNSEMGMTSAEVKRMSPSPLKETVLLTRR
jgi:hypothetical protein